MPTWISTASRAAVMGFFAVLAVSVPASAQNVDEQWEQAAQTGVRAYGLAQLDVALTQLEEALRIAEANFAADDWRTTASLINLAPLYAALDRHVDGIALAERAIAAQEVEGGPENPNLTVTLTMLAGMYRDVERFEDAEAMEGRASALMDLVLAPTTHAPSLSARSGPSPCTAPAASRRHWK